MIPPTVLDLVFKQPEERQPLRSITPDGNDRRQARATLGVDVVCTAGPSGLLDEIGGALDIPGRGFQAFLVCPARRQDRRLDREELAMRRRRHRFPLVNAELHRLPQPGLCKERSGANVVIHGEPRLRLIQSERQSLLLTVEPVPQEVRCLARERLDKPVDGMIANGVYGIRLGSDEPDFDCRRGRSPSIERVKCLEVHPPSGVDGDSSPRAAADREFVLIVEDAIRRLDGSIRVTMPVEGKAHRSFRENPTQALRVATGKECIVRTKVEFGLGPRFEPEGAHGRLAVGDQRRTVRFVVLEREVDPLCLGGDLSGLRVDRSGTELSVRVLDPRS